MELKRLNNLLTNALDRGATKDEIICIITSALRNLKDKTTNECEERIISKLEHKYNPQ